MKKRLKNCLVTGGAGFIGSHLVERLLEVIFHLAAIPRVQRSIASYTKARHLLGWEPKVKLEEGLKTIL